MVSEITPEQIAEYQRQHSLQLQANRKAFIAELEALADSRGFVIGAEPKLMMANGVFVLSAVWGVAEKAK